MLKSTANSDVPAVFSAGLLFHTALQHKEHSACVTRYLMSKNIRDFRVQPDDQINKGNDFTDFRTDRIHLLFECINFHQLFNTDNLEILTQKKVEIYNELVSHLKLNLIYPKGDCIIGDPSTYSEKIRMYMKPLIDRSINLHLCMDKYGSVHEGIQNFWKLVDHCIYLSKEKYRLNELKTLKANTDATYYD